MASRTRIPLAFIATVLACLTPSAGAAARPIDSGLDADTARFLQTGYRADAYAARYRSSWSFVRYPVRRADLGTDGRVVAENVRLRCSPDRSRVTWGAAALDPAGVRNVYLVFNSFNLGSDAEYAEMEEQASTGAMGPATMSLLNRVAPIYLRTRLRSAPQDAAATRRELVRILVGHAQLFFEFAPGACVVGDGRGTLEATPGLVVSLDAVGRKGERYDPFAGMDERKYDALYNLVDVRDALRWSTTSDTSTTFFRVKLDPSKQRHLLERMLGIAFDEQPLTHFEDASQVTISEYRYHTLFQACINTSVRILNEEFEPARRLPDVFNPCDGMDTNERRNNDLCTMFDEMRLPSAETSVFGVVGNSLVGRGLAEKVDDYPATIRRLIDEAADIDVRASYADYDIVIPGAQTRALPSLDDGLNLSAGN